MQQFIYYCCIKWVSLVNFIYDARTHIRQICLVVLAKNLQQAPVQLKVTSRMYICCILCVFAVPCVFLLYYVCISVLTLDAGLLARSQYPEGPATGHRDTGFSWFPCVYMRMLRWFPSFQVATTCLSCSPPDLNFLATFFPYLCTCKITTATGW